MLSMLSVLSMFQVLQVRLPGWACWPKNLDRGGWTYAY